MFEKSSQLIMGALLAAVVLLVWDKVSDQNTPPQPACDCPCEEEWGTVQKKLDRILGEIKRLPGHHGDVGDLPEVTP